MKAFKYIGVISIAVNCVICQAIPLTREEAISIVETDGKILEGRRANLFVPDSSIFESAVDGISITEEFREITAEKWFLTGCRPQSCGEKTAAVIDAKTKKLLVIGIKNYGCYYPLLNKNEIEKARPKSSPVKCQSEPQLNIYVFRGSDLINSAEDEEKYVGQVISWGGKIGPDKQMIYVVRRK